MCPCVFPPTTSLPWEGLFVPPQTRGPGTRQLRSCLSPSWFRSSSAVINNVTEWTLHYTHLMVKGQGWKGEEKEYSSYFFFFFGMSMGTNASWYQRGLTHRRWRFVTAAEYLNNTTTITKTDGRPGPDVQLMLTDKRANRLLFQPKNLFSICPWLKRDDNTSCFWLSASFCRIALQAPALNTSSRMDVDINHLTKEK